MVERCAGRTPNVLNMAAKGCVNVSVDSMETVLPARVRKTIKETARSFLRV